MIDYIFMIPDEFIHVLFLIGILSCTVGLILNFVPFVTHYRTIIQVVAIVILSGSAWVEGGISQGMKHEIERLEHQIKISELEKKVLEAETLAAKANGHLEIVYRDRVQLVESQRVIVQERLDNVAISIDKDCKINGKSIEILNAAATVIHEK